MSVYVGVAEKQVYIRNTNTTPETRIYFNLDDIEALRQSLDDAVQAIKRGGPEWCIRK